MRYGFILLSLLGLWGEGAHSHGGPGCTASFLDSGSGGLSSDAGGGSASSYSSSYSSSSAVAAFNPAEAGASTATPLSAPMSASQERVVDVNDLMPTARSRYDALSPAARHASSTALAAEVSMGKSARGAVAPSPRAASSVNLRSNRFRTRGVLPW